MALREGRTRGACLCGARPRPWRPSARRTAARASSRRRGRSAKSKRHAPRHATRQRRRRTARHRAAGCDGRGRVGRRNQSGAGRGAAAAQRMPERCFAVCRESRRWSDHAALRATQLCALQRTQLSSRAWSSAALTAVMVRPAAWRCSSPRALSTSGSSGIAADAALLPAGRYALLQRWRRRRKCALRHGALDAA